MSSRRKAWLTLAVILAALTVAGCGPPPPQAPLDQAKKLDQSTSGISTTCGLTYQVTAFPGNHQPDLAVLQATASSDVTKLASVYARNPKWIYQGDTIHTIVEESLSMLHQCGLTGAASTLVQATGVH
jgi:hypothetical protein